MNWINLTSEEELTKAIEESNEQPVLIFKHSTRCSISSMALGRFERGWDDSSKTKTYFLDLISFRSVSDQIAEALGVMHQSPQAILIKDGKAVKDASHMNINAKSFLS